MALPSSYNESTLTRYMLDTLGSIATTLSLTAIDMGETVNDVLAAYGVSDIANATDVVKLRALARVGALRRAQAASLAWNFPGFLAVRVRWLQNRKPVGAKLDGS